MNKEYLDMVKELYIKDYIEKNSKVPNNTEINQYVIEFKKDNPEIERYGLVGSFLEKFAFLESGSAEKENKNFEYIRKDIETQNVKIDKTVSKMDTSVYNFKSFLSRSLKNLNSLENRLNSLIINYSNADLFLHSIEEDFKNHNFIDLENSTVDVLNGYATIKNKVDYLDLTSSSCSFSFRTKNKVISRGANFPVKEILVSNGKEWVGSCLTIEKTGRVVLEIEIDLKENEGKYINSVVIDGRPMDVNCKTYYGIEIVQKSKAYRAIVPRIKRFSNGENFTSINSKNVKKIRVSLIKEVADEEVQGSNRYIFNINNIKIRTDKVEPNKSGVLFAGPYEVKDSFGAPINFSMAKFSTDTCCIVPEKTSVDFFISKDNENWTEAFYDEEYQNVIKFSNINLSNKGEVIDSNENMFGIIKHEGEYFLNFKIESRYIKNISKNNIKVKRNLNQHNVLYKANGGWYFDKKTQRYITTIKIDKIEGKYIDLGYTSAIVNGFEKSGKFHLREGYHVIETGISNYLEITRGITNSEEFLEEDKLNPYNHKYIFEGYGYPSNFEGEKDYPGFEENFSFLNEYIPEEKFDLYEDLKVYTILEREGYSYFKVNIDSSDYSWKKELNNVIIYGSESTNNIFYIKAIVRSSDDGTVPHINSFTVRVI